MSECVIAFRVTTFERRKLKELADQHSKTIADLLREALNEVIADFHDGPPVCKPRNRPRSTSKQ